MIRFWFSVAMFFGGVLTIENSNVLIPITFTSLSLFFLLWVIIRPSDKFIDFMNGDLL